MARRTSEEAWRKRYSNLFCNIIQWLRNFWILPKSFKNFDLSDAEEEKKKQELREIAKKELEDWYKNHEETIAKTKAANR